MSLISRRQFSLLASFVGSRLLLTAQEGWSHTWGEHSAHMPDDVVPHRCTWMAFIASDQIWARRQIAEVQRNLATIAKTIAKYEPVMMLVRAQDRSRAMELLGGLNSHIYPIELIDCPLDDLWIRDTGPVFVTDADDSLSAIDFNFNGWGEDQDYDNDAEVARFVAHYAHAKVINTDLVLEGGCFEVDGHGTAIMTESCILNDNRNPGVTKSQVERELKALLGLEKIIWLKGIKGRDITDGHTDFYARFVRPGVVIASRDIDRSSYDYKITRQNIEILQQAKDARGKPLSVVIMDTPWDINSRYGTRDFAAGYVGYYVCNGAVIMQKFGDVDADNIAAQKMSTLFPRHRIEQIAIDGIASGGGSIHCATQQQPLV